MAQRSRAEIPQHAERSILFKRLRNTMKREENNNLAVGREFISNIRQKEKRRMSNVVM